MNWYNPGPIFADLPVAIIGQGPSIIPEQVAKISSLIPTIALKDTYIWAPEAVIIYAGDRSWWKNRWRTDDELRKHRAINLTLDYQKLDTGNPNLMWLKCTGNEGFALESGCVRHGRNTGHQAVDFAAGCGAKKIILLGYDMRAINGKAHCHDRHVAVPHSVFKDFIGPMTRAAPLLANKSVKVVNTSMESALMCFPKLPFDKALDWGLHG